MEYNLEMQKNFEIRKVCRIRSEKIWKNIIRKWWATYFWQNSNLFNPNLCSIWIKAQPDPDKNPTRPDKNPNFMMIFNKYSNKALDKLYFIQIYFKIEYNFEQKSKFLIKFLENRYVPIHSLFIRGHLLLLILRSK